jgi:hypothetical protein
MSILDRLPVDLLLEIFRHLPIVDVTHFLSTSKWTTRYVDVLQNFIIAQRIKQLGCNINDHDRLGEIQTFEQLDAFEQVVEQAEFLCRWRKQDCPNDPTSKYHPVVVSGAEANGTFKYSLWRLSNILYKLSLDNGLPSENEYLYTNFNRTGFMHLHKTLRTVTYPELQHVYGTFMFIRSLLFRMLP